MHLEGNGAFEHDAEEQDPGGTDASEGTMADHSIASQYYPLPHISSLAPFRALGGAATSTRGGYLAKQSEN